MNTNALDDRSHSDALPDAETLNRIQVEYDFPAGTGAVHDIMLPHRSGTSDSSPQFVFAKLSIPADIALSIAQHFTFVLSCYCTGPNWSDSPRRAFNLRYCSAEGLLGKSMYSNPLTGEKRPREFILVCGEDTARKGFGRVPSWRNGGVCYTGEAGVDAS